MSLLLGSTVIAALVTIFYNFIISSKHNELQYITAERKEWRTRIRKLERRLTEASYAETLKIINELKMNINAYGMDEKIITCDSHIWELIKKIESTSYNQDNLKKDQRMLIDYIALLLKYDWERSKKEIKVDTSRILYIGIFIMCISSLSLGIMESGFEIENIKNIIILMLFALLIAVFNGIFVKKIENVIFRLMSKEDIYKRKSRENGIIIFISVIVVVLTLVYIMVIEFLFRINDTVNEYIGLGLFFYIIGTYLQIYCIFEKMDEQLNYIRKVLNIKNSVCSDLNDNEKI